MTRWLWVLLALDVLAAAYCLAGTLGCKYAGDPAADAVCLPINLAYAAWNIVLLRRVRADR